MPPFAPVTHTAVSARGKGCQAKSITARVGATQLTVQTQVHTVDTLLIEPCKALYASLEARVLSAL